MADRSPEFDEESSWLHTGPEDDLWAPPSLEMMPPPLVDTAPLLLNTHELPWETFERLVLTIARQVDGALDVRIYGKRGQKQEGIDVVGFFLDELPTIYQAKRYEAFTASDLEKAVRKYADGKRPFGARRVVVVAACEASDTAVVKTLNELRESHPDLVIDLWDRTKLSETLRDFPRIVERFFGSASSERFCGTQPEPRPRPPRIEADAVIRGPIRHLGLADELSSAELELATDPARASERFSTIAARLEASPFAGHAVQVRMRQAQGLQQAGDVAGSFRVRLAVAWNLIDSADLWTSRVLLNEMGETGSEFPEELVRSAYALETVVRLRREHSATVDDVAARFDDLELSDPHRELAALALAEEAVAAHRGDLISTRAPILKEVAQAQSRNASSQLIGARLQACIADATDDWTALALTARELYDPPTTALLLARHARYLTLTRNPEMATLRYTDAIERATAERRYGDASNWLYALRAVRLQYGLLDGDPNDMHRLAQALQSQGEESVLPAGAARERALKNLNARKWPDALESLRRYLWHATVTASWAAEIEAHELIGDVFAETGRPLAAVNHYVLAGATKKLAGLASQLPDELVTYSPELIGVPSWERRASYAFVTAVADLLADEDAAAWARVGLDDAMAEPATLLPGPYVGLAGFKAFAEFSEMAGEADAAKFLDYASQLVQREPGRYRPTDEAHAKAVIGIGQSNAALRTVALDQALDLLLADDQMARVVLSEGGELLRAQPERVEEKLQQAANEGRSLACLALIVAGCDTEEVKAHAQARLETAIAPRVHEPGVQHIGTSFLIDAALVSVLPLEQREDFVDAMLRHARDHDEPASNRQDALLAAERLVKEISVEARKRMFAVSIECARGEHDVPEDPPFQSAPDPLSRFQFNFGSQSLQAIGLRCAARCAITSENIDVVQQMAFDLLSEADDATVNQVAHALSALPVERLAIHADVFSSHSNVWVRSLAAVIWAASPRTAPHVGLRLAADPSPHVRRSLASALGTGSEHDAVRAVLAADARRSVRTASRTEVRGGQ